MITKYTVDLVGTASGFSESGYAVKIDGKTQFVIQGVQKELALVIAHAFFVREAYNRYTQNSKKLIPGSENWESLLEIEEYKNHLKKLHS